MSLKFLHNSIKILVRKFSYKRVIGVISISDISKYQPLDKMMYFSVFALLVCSYLHVSTAFPIDPTKAVSAGIGFISDVLGGKDLTEAMTER